MKYSCCLYPTGGETLAQAEIAMLETYVQKAQLKDGMSILDLGYFYPPNHFIYSLLIEYQMWLGFGSSVFCRNLS